MTTSAPEKWNGSARRPRRGPIRWTLDLLSNVWFGITLVALIFVYAAVGSAGPDIAEVLRYRSFNVPHMLRHRFELTEMEWFMWWPFQILIGLLVLSLIVVTLRRIPFKPVNFGVWSIHLGIIIMCVGSYIYFSQKVEGDVAVYRREAVISVPGADKPTRMIIRPGETKVVGGSEGMYHIAVSNINPAYTLLGGPDKGKDTYAVYLDITTPTDHFTRQMLVGYPDNTEDFRPGQGRTKGLIDPNLDIQLDYSAVDHFFLMDSACIYVREVGETEWTPMPVRKIPRYFEYVASRDDVWVPSGMLEPPIKPLDIPVKPKTPDKDLDGLSFAITGFVPFAVMQDKWTPDGRHMNPVMGLSVEIAGRPRMVDFIAFDPRRNTIETETFPIHFMWVNDEAQVAELTEEKSPRIEVKVPGSDINLDLPLTAFEGDQPFNIEGTDYTLRFIRAMPWTLVTEPHAGEKAFLAMFEVRKGDDVFTRALVHPYPELTQDIDSSGQRHSSLLDEGIEIVYRDPIVPGLTFAAGPQDGELTAVFRAPDGKSAAISPRIGETFKLADNVPPMTVEYVYRAADKQTKPMLIPPEQRDTKARNTWSLVKLNVRDGDWSQSVWLPFSQYSHPGRFPFEPRIISTPGGRKIEVLFSRQKRPLPAAVALQSFELPTYPGEMRERDYISHVRFAKDDGTWDDEMEIRSNQPGTYKHYWFFQSTWDPPDPSRNYAGMNYTGLGVGNREGVLTMLTGTIIAILGMIYAFYVKPLIKRRQRLAVLAQVGKTASAGSRPESAASAHAPAREPMEV